MRKNRKVRLIRVTAALFAIALAMPSVSYAKETDRVLGKIHHVHTGNPEEGGGCYGKEIKHVHQGDEESGGSCFLSPVYHVHQGDERGGECYRTEVYHAHEGTEENGEGCYGEPVYHAHEGNTGSKGGCYSQPVYHVHAGNTAGKGGCYNQPVYHVHTGNQAAKGGCYNQPVYHTHSGSTAAKGGCYQNAVYHAHAGSETSGGGCYAPVYHQHTDACYQEAQCIMEYLGDFQVVREESGYCGHHGNVLVMHFKAGFRHMSCGRGVVEDSNSTCWTCQMLNSWHTYNKVVCGKTDQTIEKYQRICGKETNTVESWGLSCGKNGSSVEKYAQNCGKNEKTVVSYQRNCGKDESTVDSYTTGCGKAVTDIERYRLNCGRTSEDVDSYAQSCIKNEETIDGYSLSCEKTEETTDGYALSCGRSEQEGYAEFSVSNRDSRWTSGEVVLQAEVQDSEGYLQLPEVPFEWKGKWIDGVFAQEVKVKENGIYYVHLLAENEDMDKKETVLSIEVRNIDVTPPVIEGIGYSGREGTKGRAVYVTARDVQPDGSPGSGLASEAYSFDGGKTWQKENRWELKTAGIISLAVKDSCGNVSMQNIEIQNIDEEDGKEESGKKEDETNTENDGEGGKGGIKAEDNSENDGGETKTENDHGSGKEEVKEENSGGNEGEGSEKGSGSEQGKKADAGSAEGQERKESLSPEEVFAEKETAEKEALKKRKSSSGGSDSSGTGGGTDKSGSMETAERENETKGKNGVRMPDRKETCEKEIIREKAAETAAKPETGKRSGIVRQTEATERIVKAVTFTVSGIMLASGMLYLIYLMFRSIQIYDCDGEGNLKYAGSCIMKKTEEGFEVKIPDMIWEHSATGQYSLRPGRIFAGRNKGKELAVTAGEHRESVWIDREIPLRMKMNV